MNWPHMIQRTVYWFLSKNASDTQKLTFKILYQCCIFEINNISSWFIMTYYTSIWRWSTVVYCRVSIMPFGGIFTELSWGKESSTFENKWTSAFFHDFRATYLFINANYKYFLLIIILELYTIWKSNPCTLYS